MRRAAFALGLAALCACGGKPKVLESGRRAETLPHRPELAESPRLELTACVVPPAGADAARERAAREASRRIVPVFRMVRYHADGGSDDSCDLRLVAGAAWQVHAKDGKRLFELRPGGGADPMGPMVGALHQKLLASQRELAR